MRNLQTHGIAHGDLQHGNVLVAADELRLIDYDGMYVPPLSGRESHEIGHRNYQHPCAVSVTSTPAWTTSRPGSSTCRWLR
ncbi:MAG: hypothetical protein HZY76_21580 [Anaerolineae bacterium]|nr:MAG: hypothetical protein HZY76_21580 [Anaerolineae bacterium]